MDGTTNENYHRTMASLNTECCCWQMVLNMVDFSGIEQKKEQSSEAVLKNLLRAYIDHS